MSYIIFACFGSCFENQQRRHEGRTGAELLRFPAFSPVLVRFSFTFTLMTFVSALDDIRVLLVISRLKPRIEPLTSHSLPRHITRLSFRIHCPSSHLVRCSQPSLPHAATSSIRLLSIISPRLCFAQFSGPLSQLFVSHSFLCLFRLALLLPTSSAICPPVLLSLSL